MMKQLTIDAIELYKLSIPLKQPFITSLGADEVANNLIVKITTRVGIIGFGECSPYMPINGESQETCYIVGQYFAKALLGKNALDIASCIQLMDKIIYKNTAVKSAFDIALYDIAAQAAGQPLFAFLGGKNDKTIVTDYTVSVGDPAQMVKEALQIQADGYPAIKVKLGLNGKTDVERMKAIRNAVGPDIPLRIDANQGWEVAEAIETLQALAPLHIQHCEEPIARWNFMQLSTVKNASPIPIMADESCGDEHDAATLIQLDACQYMNIKLCKSGGLFKALKIVKLAEAAQIQLQVGAMLESRLAMSAFAHFALCSPAIVHFDFDTALMFREDPVTGGIQYRENGVITVPETPGLGAVIDDERLSAMEHITFKN